MRIFIAPVLFYVVCAIILFAVYSFTMGPQDGGFGTYALSLMVFAVLVFVNFILNIVWGFKYEQNLYFVIALIHLAIFITGVLFLGV